MCCSYVLQVAALEQEQVAKAKAALEKEAAGR
jgi:hypothetical protein